MSSKPENQFGLLDGERLAAIKRHMHTIGEEFAHAASTKEGPIGNVLVIVEYGSRLSAKVESLIGEKFPSNDSSKVIVVKRENAEAMLSDIGFKIPEEIIDKACDWNSMIVVLFCAEGVVCVPVQLVSIVGADGVVNDLPSRPMKTVNGKTVSGKTTSVDTVDSKSPKRVRDLSLN